MTVATIFIRSQPAHCRPVGWKQGVVFTRNTFTIDTVRMRMYAPIIPGKTQFGKNCGVRCLIIRRYPLAPHSLKQA